MTMTLTRTMTIGEVKELLRGHGNDTPCACVLWLPKNIQKWAKEEGEELSDKEVRDILNYLHWSDNTTLRLSWKALRWAANDFKKWG